MGNGIFHTLGLSSKIAIVKETLLNFYSNYIFVKFEDYLLNKKSSPRELLKY
jgi:hypothetical protein